MVTIKLPKNNFELRVIHIGCCLADKAMELRTQLTLGFSCADNILLFQYYSALFEILKEYKIDDALECDEQNLINCLTTEEVNIIFNNFADYCSHCYPSEGTDLTTLADCPTCP